MLKNLSVNHSQAVDPVVIPWGEGLVGGVANSGKLVNVIHADHVNFTFTFLIVTFTFCIPLSLSLVIFVIIIIGTGVASSGKLVNIIHAKHVSISHFQFFQFHFHFFITIIGSGQLWQTCQYYPC